MKLKFTNVDRKFRTTLKLRSYPFSENYGFYKGTLFFPCHLHNWQRHRFFLFYHLVNFHLFFLYPLSANTFLSFLHRSKSSHFYLFPFPFLSHLVCSCPILLLLVWLYIFLFIIVLLFLSSRFLFVSTPANPHLLVK